MKRTLNIIICVLAAGLITSTASAEALTKEDYACYVAFNPVAEAMAKGDLAGAKKSAGDLAEKATAAKAETIAKHARELANSGSLESARDHFKLLREAFVNWLAELESRNPVG